MYKYTYCTCTIHGSSFFYENLRSSSPQEPTPTATVLAMEAISKHPDLWPRYFSDFILHKMKLETDSGEGIAQKILEAFFAQLHEQAALQKLVILHTYLHVYQLDLAKMAGMFRPLNKIQKVSCSISPYLPAPPSLSLCLSLLYLLLALHVAPLLSH